MINIGAYKNRKIDLNKPVKVYRNLNNGLLSIVQNGHVVAHTDQIFLENCTTHVSEAGRQRTIKLHRKNVHAFIQGYITHIQLTDYEKARRIYYNPYNVSKFVWYDTSTTISNIPYCYIQSKGRMYELIKKG